MLLEEIKLISESPFTMSVSTKAQSLQPNTNIRSEITPIAIKQMINTASGFLVFGIRNNTAPMDFLFQNQYEKLTAKITPCIVLDMIVNNFIEKGASADL